MNPAATPQPPPTPGKIRVLDSVLEELANGDEFSKRILADLVDRAEQGREKYGTYLETHNGRDALWDAYQEALDAVMYTRQHYLEIAENGGTVLIVSARAMFRSAVGLARHIAASLSARS
jgi:hypothetical protein